MNAVTFSGTAIPRFFFQRRDDFGIWPTPQGAYTITLTFIPRHKDMSASDYTTGTVTVTNDDATVAGSGTTFTAAMVGRFFKSDDDGFWYRIKTFTSTTSIELENVFQGTTAAGESFTIGDSPEIPEEIHPHLAFRAANMYFIQLRKNPSQSAVWGNMFWTGDAQNSSRQIGDAAGGLLGAKKRYSTRSSTGVIRKISRLRRNTFNDRAWSTTIS